MTREVLITPAALVKPAPVQFLHPGLVPLRRRRFCSASRDGARPPT